MKQMIFMASAMLLLLSACYSSEEMEERNLSSNVKVQFHIQPIAEISNFPSTKSIPDGTPAEPGYTKGGGEGQETNPVDNSTLFSHIEFFVYSEASELLHSESYSKAGGDDDFGAYINTSLAPGTYTACILAHSDNSVTKEGNVVSFTKIGDSYYAKVNFTISPNDENFSKDVTLNRIVAKVEFVSTDYVPSYISGFQIDVAGQYHKFNMLNGAAESATTTLTLNPTIESAHHVTTFRGTHEFFTFVPSSENAKVTTAVLKSLKEGTSVRTREIKDIPIYVNRITRYTGTLYTPGEIGAQFELTVNSDWGLDDNHPLTD